MLKLLGLLRKKLFGPDGRARRCASDSLMCMLVYIFSGHCSQTAADFVRGRGWRPGLSDLAEQEEIVADVEWAYICMPTVTLVALVDLELAPLTLVSKKDVLCAAQYVLERRLAAYVEVQNIQHGVAPSRERLVECATSSIPSAAPADVQHRLLSLVPGDLVPGKSVPWGQIIIRNEHTVLLWLVPEKLVPGD